MTTLYFNVLIYKNLENGSHGDGDLSFLVFIFYI